MERVHAKVLGSPLAAWELAWVRALAEAPGWQVRAGLRVPLSLQAAGAEGHSQAVAVMGLSRAQDLQLSLRQAVRPMVLQQEGRLPLVSESQLSRPAEAAGWKEGVEGKEEKGSPEPAQRLH